MISSKGQIDLFSPIWGDYFAGGAGASTGIACAVGEPAYFAVNHNPAALDMYKQNHPHTRLYCEDVFDVNGKPYSKADKVARCGNAVCPAVSEALVRANFPERCIKPMGSMAELKRTIAV